MNWLGIIFGVSIGINIGLACLGWLLKRELDRVNEYADKLEDDLEVFSNDYTAVNFTNDKDATISVLNCNN